jgi:hypothetical protein
VIRSKWVALAGGLGNQLFQYAYSISNREMLSESTLECVGFRLGTVETFRPEIGKFRLPQAKLSLDHWANSHLEQKAFNYLLRISTHKNSLWRFNPLSLVARAVVLPRILFMKIQKNRKSQYKRSEHSRLLEIGYFQNSEITQEAISTMKGLSLLQTSSVLDEHIALAKVEKPLVLHIRRGDYRHNPKLGCLSGAYYQQILEEVWLTGEFNKIWLFSDDLESSFGILDLSLHPFVRVIDERISPAETFEIMRLGSGYIIANSSFSFWAAALRRNQDSIVRAPLPWFKKTYFHDKNFPLDWKLIPAQFDSY